MNCHFELFDIVGKKHIIHMNLYTEPGSTFIGYKYTVEHSYMSFRCIVVMDTHKISSNSLGRDRMGRLSMFRCSKEFDLNHMNQLRIGCWISLLNTMDK